MPAVSAVFRRMAGEPLDSCFAFLIFLVSSFGAATVFSLSVAALQRPLPFDVPHDSIVIWGQNDTLQLDRDDLPISVPAYLAIKDASAHLRGLEIVRAFDALAGQPGSLEQVRVIHATAGLFELLQFKAYRGRVFDLRDGLEGAPGVALVHHDFALRRFGEPDRSLGERLFIDGRAYEIVGVMKPGFDFPSGAQNVGWLKASVDVWLPKKILEYDRTNYGDISYVALGRLNDGSDLESVNTELEETYRALEKDVPEAFANWHAFARTLKQQALGSLSPILATLGAGAGFLIAIAMVNYAILTLSRAIERGGEFALRQSLGASKPLPAGCS